MSDDFPHLQSEGFAETSPATRAYNCIAWAAGFQDDWWWPEGFSHWPDQAPRELTLAAFCAAFQRLGYERCDAADVEAGFDKVAFYVLAGEPTHAARQLPNGSWTSKLGEDIDITHTLPALEG